MKTRLYSLALAVVLFSCGGQKEPVTVEEKEAKVLEYRKQISELQTKISTLEADINTAKGVNPEDKLRTVEVAGLAPITFEHFVEVQGNVESDQNVKVFPKVAGLIVRRMAEEGQAVTKGQAIAELDVEQIRKAIAELEVRLSLAKTAYERQERLWQQKIGSEMQYLQAKSGKEALEKTIEAQKNMINDAVVRASISGVIEKFFLKEGEMASQATPIANIVNTSSLKISAEVSEVYVKNVKRGDEVKASFPTLNMEMPVRVALIGQTINAVNRTFRIELPVANRDGVLKPNAMAVVKIKDFSQKDAIAVPSHIVQQSTTGDQFVYVVRSAEGKEKVERVVVATGQSYQGSTHITQGLQSGDRLIVKGYNEVVSGEEVKVAK